MEDCNTLAADCVVISCCCQCLILRVVIFVLLELPFKMIRKTKQYAEKKLRRRRKEGKMTGSTVVIKGRGFESELVELHNGSVSIRIEGFSVEGGHGCDCMKEVETVLEELSEKGEFAFGSFWGREMISGRPPTCIAPHETHHFSVVQYELIEIVNCFDNPFP